MMVTIGMIHKESIKIENNDMGLKNEMNDINFIVDYLESKNIFVGVTHYKHLNKFYYSVFDKGCFPPILLASCSAYGKTHNDCLAYACFLGLKMHIDRKCK